MRTRAFFFPHAPFVSPFGPLSSSSPLSLADYYKPWSDIKVFQKSSNAVATNALTLSMALLCQCHRCAESGHHPNNNWSADVLWWSFFSDGVESCEEIVHSNI